MSDTYLIDGYNLIHALGLIAQPAGPHVLEHARRRLLDYLAASFGSDAVHITVVFDARNAPARVSRQQTYQGMQIQFASGNISADDLIEALIAAHPTPGSLVVISNDNRLQQAAHRRGAHAWTHTHMLDYFDRKRSSVEPGSVVREEKRAEPLSREEMEHWLNEFESLETDSECKEFFDLDRFQD